MRSFGWDTADAFMQHDAQERWCFKHPIENRHVSLGGCQWLSVVLVCASVALFIFRIAGAEQTLVWSPRRANERYPDRWGNQEVQLFQLSNSSCQQAFSAFIPRARTLTNVLWWQAFRGWIRELHRMRASKISPWLAGVLNLYVIAVIPIEYGSDCRVRSSGVDVDYCSQRNETQGPEPLSWRIWDWSIVQLSSCNATLLRCYTATLLHSMKVFQSLTFLDIPSPEPLSPRFYDLQLNVKDESGAEITSLEDAMQWNMVSNLCFFTTFWVLCLANAH